MKLTPQKFREAVVLFLFSMDFTEDMVDTFPLISEQLKISSSNTKEALEKAQFLMTHAHDLDLLIAKYSKSYDFHRIPFAEKTILRLAFFELVVEKTLHYKVIISEAIRLARKFASPEAGGFVNALLDQYVKEYFPNQNEPDTKNQDPTSS